MSLPITANIRASDIPGYKTVQHLIPEGNFLKYTIIWAIRVEYYVTELNELSRRLVLDLGHDFDLDDKPLIRVSMLQPGQFTIPVGTQIMGLAFGDIRDRRWEGLNYEVYDFEDNCIRATCHSIELSQVAKPTL